MNAIIKLLDPYRWLIGGLLAFAVSAGVLWWRSSLIADGRALCEEEHRIALAKAQKAQGEENTVATKEVIKVETLIETKYRDKIKEVIKYVPSPATPCIADADFLRQFNE